MPGDSSRVLEVLVSFKFKKEVDERRFKAIFDDFGLEENWREGGNCLKVVWIVVYKGTSRDCVVVIQSMKDCVGASFLRERVWLKFWYLDMMLL